MHFRDNESPGNVGIFVDVSDYVVVGGLAIRNCVFDGDADGTPTNDTFDGAAITFTNTHGLVPLTIEDCAFRQLTARNGGAVHALLPTVFTLRRSVFERNSALHRGGAVFVDVRGRQSTESPKQVESVLIEGCVFTENSAGETGGALYVDFSRAIDQAVGQLTATSRDGAQGRYLIDSNTFTRNSALYAAGAVRVNGWNSSQTGGDELRRQHELLVGHNSYDGNVAHLSEAFAPEGSESVLVACIYGEMLSESPDSSVVRSCVQCTRGLFSPATRAQSSVGTCQQCPHGFECPGGQQNLVTRAGFWSTHNTSRRAFEQSLTAHECDAHARYHGRRRLNVCVGVRGCWDNARCYSDPGVLYDENAPSDHSVCCTRDTSCLKGYLGPLCVACDAGGRYAEGYGSSCVYCGAATSVILPLVELTVFIELIVVVSLLSYRRKYQLRIKDRVLRVVFNHYSMNSDYSSLYLKIFSNYLQNLLVITSLQISLPPLAKVIQSYFLSVLSAMTRLGVQYECFSLILYHEH